MKSKRLRLIVGLLAIGVCVLGTNAAPALALSPSVETLAASPIEEKGATLNGKVNPNGAETKMYFEYGTTTSYGSKTSEVNVGSGNTTLEKNQAISGLSANTVYHFRIVATNSSGTSQGADKTFTTVGAPAVSGLSGSELGSFGEEATLKATVDPNGQSTTYQFEYGLSEGSLPNVVPVPAGSAGSGYEPVNVESVATGLTPGTKYYVRVSATNASGKVSSSVISFLSSKEPGLSGVAASKISRNGAELKATIESNGFVTSYYFEYGTTTSYGTKTTNKEGSGAVSESLSGLKASTVFHYRVVASNKEGTHTGPDQTFTTLPAVSLKAKGSLIGAGEPLSAFSSNLKFNDGAGGQISCAETEFAGSVTENPGAAQSVSTAKMQNGGGAGCTHVNVPSATAKMIVNTAGMTVDYAKDELGEGVATTSTFPLHVTFTLVIFGKPTKSGECEYSLQLSGPFALEEPLTATLSGKLELIKTLFGNCPNGEISGTFAVTSKGNAVEAS